MSTLSGNGETAEKAKQVMEILDTEIGWWMDQYRG